MRNYGMAALCMGCILAGCQEERQQATGRRPHGDAVLVRTLHNGGAENAIIAQSTLYPYHFAADRGGNKKAEYAARRSDRT